MRLEGFQTEEILYLRIHLSRSINAPTRPRHTHPIPHRLAAGPRRRFFLMGLLGALKPSTPQPSAAPADHRSPERPGTYQSVCGSSTTSRTLAFLAAAGAGAGASTRPAEAAVCFTAWDSELKKLLPTDGAGAACGAGCGADAGAGGGLRSGPGEAAGGADEAEAAPEPGGGGGGCWGSGRCRSVM